MKPEDFTKEKFILKVPVYLNREQVFDLLSTSEGLTRWFLGEVDFFNSDGNKVMDGNPLHPDEIFHWTWQKGYQLKGKVINYVPGQQFEFSFGGDFSVSITLEEINGKDVTELTLTQVNHQPSALNEFGFTNCCVCWTFFLTNLKSVAEKNIDLRETNLIDESFINQ